MVFKYVVAALAFGPIAWVYRWVWQLNQKAVRTDLAPRLAELETLRQELAD